MSLLNKLTIWGTLATIFSFTANALSLPSNALESLENKFKIELIDVKCDKNEDGMHVTVEFAEPFDGIIYSQRYFSDPKCRYVSAGQSEKSYNFVVPFEGCGSKASCAICDSIDNILIIQQDEELQSEFDAARKISCSRSGIDEEKKVFFKPFIVDMLDVVTVPTAHGQSSVDCWMDIKSGIFPKLTAIGDVIKIGEALSVLVYLRDQQKQYDLSVRNCWAYDGEDFDDKKTAKVQLSDASGCSMKRKLFGSWQKTTETGSSGATLLLHNTLRAFKFPDEAQVFLKCDIEICRGTCAEAICDADDNTIVDCSVDPLNAKCIREQLIDRSGSTSGFTKLPSKPSSISSITTRMPFTMTTAKRPSFGISTTERVGFTSTPFVNQFKTTQSPETTTFSDATTFDPLQTTTVKTGLDSFCALYPQSKRCSQRVTEDFGANIEILTFKPPSPFATVKYQRTTIPPKFVPDNEINPTTDSRVDEPPLICKGEILDPRCPNPTPTNTPPTYLPPSTTIRMVTSRFETSTIPPTEFTTNQPITKQPKQPKQPITKKPNKLFICVPGSNDVNCDYESTKADVPTTQEPTKQTTTFVPSRNQVTTKKPYEKPICFIGSTNPECRKVSTDILTFKPKPSTTSIPLIISRQGVTTTTRAPICYPGSLDPRCVKVTTKKPVSISSVKPIPDEIPVIIVPVCYPGSTDPRCPQTENIQTNIPRVTTPTVKTTTTLPERTTYAVPSTTRAPICYIGSADPRCIKSTTKRPIVPSFSTTEEVTTKIPTSTTVRYIPSSVVTPRCYPGSLDPRCPQIKSTQKPIPTGTAPTISTTTALPETTTNAVPSTTRSPICYPGSQDPRCPQINSTEKPIPRVTTPTITTTNALPETTTYAVPSTRSPICYPGSRDPKCSKSPTIQTSTPAIATTESTPTKISSPKVILSTTTTRCYPGSLDARCLQTTTRKISFGTTTKVTTEAPSTSTQIVTTNNIVSKTFAPRCYPGSLDPQCIKPTAKTGFTTLKTASQITTKLPAVSTVQSSGTTRAPVCYPGALDPRCSKTTTTKKLISPVDTRQDLTTEAPSSSTFKSVSNVNTVPGCYLGFLDPKCAKQTTTQRTIQFSTTKPTTIRPTFSTTQAQLKCYPGSLDPRCAPKQEITPLLCKPGQTLDPRCPNPTPTADPDTYLPPLTSTASGITKPPIFTNKPTIPFFCSPNSLDPRCNSPSTKTSSSVSIEGLRTTATYSPEITTKAVSTTTTQKPIYTSTQRSTFTFPTFTTRRIYSSPQPFTTRPPTVSSTTENLLCYPGSPIEGCNSSFTTPSFCYPGSTDKRCPQLPPSFSTREPATYLPPYPDTRLNRVKRQALNEIGETREIVKFSLSFKPFSFR